MARKGQIREIEGEGSVSVAMRLTRDKLKHHFKARTVLLLITVVGFVLRLPGLERDLWYDETWTVFNARGVDVWQKIIPNGPEFTSDMFARDGGWRDSLRAIGHSEYNPPLYFLLLRPWTKLFGESNRTLRLLSVIFGLVSILAMFFLGRRLFDEKTGLAAAGVLAILPLHIQFSQEVRSHALAFLLVTLASWVYWRAYQAIGQHQEQKYWLLYIGLAAASLYTHYFTASIFIAHGLFALIQPSEVRRALVKRLLLVAGGILLFLAPWLLSPYFSAQVHLGRFVVGPTFRELATLKRIAVLICHLVAGWLPEMKFKSLLGTILLSLYGMSAVVALSVARGRERRPSVLFSFLLLLTPIFFMIGMAAIFNQALLITMPKYTLPALTGICLLFAAVITYARWRAQSILMAIMVIAVSLYFQVKWHEVNTSPTPPPGIVWFYGNVSPVVARVSERARPGELILFDDDAWLAVVWIAYQRSPTPLLLMSRTSFAFNPPMDYESKWQEVKSKYGGIYVVRRAGEPPSELIERLETDYRLMSRERIERLEIRHYVKPSEPQRRQYTFNIPRRLVLMLCPCCSSRWQAGPTGGHIKSSLSAKSGGTGSSTSDWPPPAFTRTTLQPVPLLFICLPHRTPLSDNDIL